MIEMSGTASLINAELLRRNLDVTTIQLPDRSLHTFVYEGELRRIVGTIPDISNAVSRQIADNKLLTQLVLACDQRIAEHLIPTEECHSTHDVEQFLGLHKQIVLKPVDGAHGRGVVTDITQVEQVADALHFAESGNHDSAGAVLAQKQVSGVDVRLLVIDNEVVAIASRKPATVIGDGSHTVKQLIDIENRTNPNRGKVPYSNKMNLIDENAVSHFLGSSQLREVPDKGSEIQVVGTANVGTGGQAVEYSHQLPSEIKQYAQAVTSFLGMFVAGVDIMYDEESGEYWLVEINASPTFTLHHNPSVGNGVNVAAIFIDKLLQKYNSLGRRRTTGVSAGVDFVGYKNLKQIPARIDTGARTSSLWASDIKVKDGIVTFKLFGPGAQWYTGKVLRREILEQREVTSSTGHAQLRYMVEMRIRMHGKKMNAKFTLSNRSTQTYPILIGRNTLRGNFLVDSGDPGEAKLYKYPEEANEFNECEAA